MTVRINKSLDHGWAWVVLPGCFCIFFLIQGIAKCMGLIYLELLEKLDGSASATAWVIALATAGRLLVGPFTSALCKRFGCRIVTIIGGLVASVGLLLGSFTISIPYEFFAIGVCYGIGSGLYFPCALIMTVKYFDKRLGLAASVGSAGGGLGMIVFPTLFNFFINTFGFSGTLFLLAGINLHVIVVGALFRPPVMIKVEENEERDEQDVLLNGAMCEESKCISSDLERDANGAGNESFDGRTLKPTSDDQEIVAAEVLVAEIKRNNGNDVNGVYHGVIEIEERPSRETRTHTTKLSSNPDLVNKCPTKETSNACFPIHEATSQSSEGDLSTTLNGCCTKKPAFISNLMIYPGFWMYLGQGMLVGFAMLSFMTFFPALADERGATLSEAALLLTISSVVDIPAKLLTGFIIDKKKIRPHRRHVLNASIFINATIVSVTPLTSSFAELAAVGIALGLMQGIYHAHLLVVLVDIFGRERQADVIGWAMFSRSISWLCGPSVIGYIKDVTKSYNSSFYMCGAVGAAAGFLFFTQFFFPLPPSEASSTIIGPTEKITTRN